MKNRILLSMGLLCLPLCAAHVDIHKETFAQKRLALKKAELVRKQEQLTILQGNAPELKNEILQIMNEIAIMQKSLDALGVDKE